MQTSAKAYSKYQVPKQVALAIPKPTSCLVNRQAVATLQYPGKLNLFARVEVDLVLLNMVNPELLAPDLSEHSFVEPIFVNPVLATAVTVIRELVEQEFGGTVLVVLVLVALCMNCWRREVGQR
jgi:hypothetical protein